MACRSGTPGTRQKVTLLYRSAGVGVRVEPAQPECMAAAIVLSLLSSRSACVEWPNATQNTASCPSLALILGPSSAPGRARTLFSPACARQATDRLRQPADTLPDTLHARPLTCVPPSRCLVWPIICELHARPSASLGSLQPKPSPSPCPIRIHNLSTPPKLFSLIISPPRPHHSSCALPLPLRPDLRPSTLLPQVLSPPSSYLSPPTTTRASVVVSSVVGSSQLSLPRQISLPETSAHLQARLRHLARPSSLLPALDFSPPPTTFAPTTSSPSACRHSLAVFDSTRRLCSSDPIVHSSLGRPIPSPAPEPIPPLTLLSVSFCTSAIRQCCCCFFTHSICTHFICPHADQSPTTVLVITAATF